MERLTKRSENGTAVYNTPSGDPVKWENNRHKVLQKLAEYEDLEEQGKLLKLPCSVGDNIYLPNKYVSKVINFEIIEICIFKEEIMLIDDSDNDYFIDDLGKIVFLTCEEAESALKEKRGNVGERCGTAE